MLYHNRIDISEGIDPTKSDKRTENALFANIRFLIIHSNFIIIFVMI